MEHYTFFGELGYVHQVILAYTQRFVKKYPEKKGNVTLITYAGNEYFFESLFPQFFKFVVVPLHDCRSGFQGHMNMFFPGIPHISEMFEEKLPNSINEMPWGDDLSKYYIESPIPKPNIPQLDEYRKYFKKVVVVFFRNRAHETLRNHDSSNKSWNDEIEAEAQDKETLFCIFNVSKEESIVPPYADVNSVNVRLIQSMVEASYWFHVCDIAYMNDSGLCDFAKNCAIKRIKIIPCISKKILYNPSVYFNPFQTKIEIFGDFVLNNPVSKEPMSST